MLQMTTSRLSSHHRHTHTYTSTHARTHARPHALHVIKNCAWFTQHHTAKPDQQVSDRSDGAVPRLLWYQAKPCGGAQDPAAYFRPAGGLLSFDMHLHDLVEQSAPHQQVLHSVNSSQAEPRQRTMKLDQDKMGHFNLVNAQIQQVIIIF